VLSTPIRSPFPWKSIWKVKAPSRVAFLVWMIALGSIIYKRGMLLWCGVVCVRNVGSLFIIFSFIVRLQQNCGVRFFNCLVLLGLCLEG